MIGKWVGLKLGSHVKAGTRLGGKFAMPGNAGAGKPAQEGSYEGPESRPLRRGAGVGRGAAVGCQAPDIANP